MARARRAVVHEEAPSPPRDHRGAALAVIAAAGIVLAILAFRFHPIGDYFTESDFYGAYARGAAAMRAGHFDPSRYGAYGPVYEAAIAVASLVGIDLFGAARLVSVLSAVTLLALSWELARRCWGGRAALWLVALVAVNAVFVRYAISACGDLLGAALFLACLVAASPERGRWGAPVAGLCAALATLTRYNLVAAVPAGLIVIALGPRPRGAAIAGFLAGFLIVVAPFIAWTAAAGHWPWETLVRDASFYLQNAPERVLEQRYGGGSGTAPPATGAALARRMVTGVPSHLVADAHQLLGWPIAALVIASLVALALRRRLRSLGPIAPFWALGFLALAPVYYSERYSLALLPLALAPAAAWLGGVRMRSASGAVFMLAGLAAACASLIAAVALQRLEYQSIPTEAIAAGQRLRSLARPGERVLARKAHIAFEAGLEPVLFPDVPTLDSLAAFCRGQQVRWLYYSWYEARLRPQFSFLLDTTSAVPGLTPVHATADKPSATYRIDPGFGRAPAWWMNQDAEARIADRVNRLLGSAAVPAK